MSLELRTVRALRDVVAALGTAVVLASSMPACAQAADAMPTSRTVTIGIRQAGGVYTFTGVVAPPVAGLQVTLARLYPGGRVVGVAATRTNAVGAYTIRTRLAPGLSGYYSLTAPTSDLPAGRSRLYGLVVPGTTTPSPGTYSAPLRTAVRQLPLAAEDTTAYDRARSFGSTWLDADRDCQNTRHEVLIAESTVAPTFTSRRCTVTAGRWTTFYDGRTWTLASQVQIDHLVPLAEAWGSGARRWTQARRLAYANDLGVTYALNAMASSLNQSKGARGPEQWLPPVNRCQYVGAWTAMKHRWRLTVDPAERAALIRLVDTCPNRVLAVPRA